jgi:hypothetical protein
MRNGVHPEEISRRTTYSTSSIFRWRAKFHKELEFFQRLERLDPEFCASYTLDAFYPDLNRQPQLLFLEEPEPPRHHLADFL